MNQVVDQDPRVGTVIGERYRVLARIGSGGMGTIYRAERLEIHKPVAIKFLHIPLASESNFLKRFEHEARAMSRLSHPNCVSIIDYGMVDAPYLVMDFVTGRTLQDLICQRQISTTRALNIGRQILAGLAHAHKQEIVHRDIKPGNVIVTEDVTGTGDFVRVLDFGLAKLRQAGVSIDCSNGNMALGTPSYMPPEQVTGGRVNASSDVYSAGLLIFEMLSGSKPFKADSVLDLMQMQVDKEPPLLRKKCPQAGFSKQLEEVLAKAMAKQQADRYLTAGEFAKALNETPEGNTPPPKTPLGYAKTIPLEAIPEEKELLRDPERGAKSRGGETYISERHRRLSRLWIAIIIVGIGIFVWYITQHTKKPHRTSAGKDTSRHAVYIDGSALAPTESPPPVPGSTRQIKPALPSVLDSRITSSNTIDKNTTKRDSLSDQNSGLDKRVHLDSGAMIDFSRTKKRGFTEDTFSTNEGKATDKTSPSGKERSNTEAMEKETTPRKLLIPSKKDKRRLSRSTSKSKRSVAKQVNRRYPKKQARQNKAKTIVETIRAVRHLRDKNPKNAYYWWLLGNLYCRIDYYSDGVDAYYRAIQLKRRYRRSPQLINNVVRALNSSARRKAEALILRRIGRYAGPSLRRMARWHKSKTMRRKASRLAKRVRKR